MYEKIASVAAKYSWLQLGNEDTNYDTDFGNIVQSTPLCIANPSTIEELRQALKLANEFEIPISVRGCAHTTGGQTLADKGMIISMKSFNNIGEIQKDLLTGDNYIGLEPGASWHDVFKVCLKAKLTPPTYADWLHLSVGGTVSTGGIGQCSFLHGSQADNVLSLDVMTIDNQQIIHCSPYENKDLFDVVRAGLGQIAIITRVNMKLQPAPEKVTIFKLLFTNLHDFINAQITLISQEKPNFHAIQSHIVTKEVAQIEKRAMTRLSPKQRDLLVNGEERWVYALEVTTYDVATEAVVDFLQSKLNCSPELFFRHECSFEEHVTRIPPIFQEPKKEQMMGHHHCCMFTSAESTESFVSEILSKSTKENTGNGTILLIPLNTSVMNAPALVMPKTKQVFMIAFLRVLNPAWATKAELEAINNYTHGRAIEMGGKVYPVGTYEEFKNPLFWQKHFNEKYAMRLTLKKMYDNKGYLSPGIKLF